MIFDSNVFSFNEGEVNQRDIKLVFVHIPKTAGTSVARVLQTKLGSKDEFRHSSIREIVQRSNINLEDYKVLTVTRNTFDRIFSTWRWYTVHKCRQFYVVDPEFQKVTFKEYVSMIKKYFDGEIESIERNKIYIEDDKPPLDKSHIEKFEWWMKDSEGQLVEHDALRFEDLKKEWNNYKHNLGIEEEMVSLNHNNWFNQNIQDAMDKESYEILSEIYKYEIERFNYE